MSIEITNFTKCAAKAYFNEGNEFHISKMKIFLIKNQATNPIDYFKNYFVAFFFSQKFHSKNALQRSKRNTFQMHINFYSNYK